MCKKKFVCQLTTRYAETDQMGVIHHGTYATYFELARIEWLRSLGLSYAKLETQGILLPVLSLSTEFRHPLYFEDQIQIEICLDSEPTSIINFSYQIFNQDKLLCTINISPSKVVVVFGFAENDVVFGAVIPFPNSSCPVKTLASSHNSESIKC